MEHSENKSTPDKDKALVEKIRSRINEVEELIKEMKSKLPNNSQ